MGNPICLRETDGEVHGQTAGQSSVIMKVIDLMPCREAGGGRENPDCIRFAAWNTETMTGKSAEVAETLHRKLEVCALCGDADPRRVCRELHSKGSS